MSFINTLYSTFFGAPGSGGVDLCAWLLRLSRLCCRLPDRAARGFALATAAVAARVWLCERHRLSEVIDRTYHRLNLLPPRPVGEVVDRLFAHYSLNSVEMLRFPLVSTAWLRDRFDLRGLENLRAALSGGRGVILVVPHVGNWELLGAAITHAGFPLHSFYLAQKERDLGAALDRLRVHTKIVLHDRDRGAREALRALKRGEILGMIADQDGGNQGVYREFLGHWVSNPAGPANWSLRTGAAVVPLYCLRRGLSDRFVAWFMPALPEPRGATSNERVIDRTETILEWMEQVILAHPDQYLWFYNRNRPRHHHWTASLKQRGHPMRRGCACYSTDVSGHAAQSP